MKFISQKKFKAAERKKGHAKKPKAIGGFQSLAAFALAKLPKPQQVVVYKEMIAACLAVGNDPAVRLGLQELAGVYRSGDLSEYVQVPEGASSVEFGQHLLLAEVKQLIAEEQMYGYHLHVPSGEYSKLQMEGAWKHSLRILINTLNQGASSAVQVEAFLVLASLMKKPGNADVQEMALNHFRPAVVNDMGTEQLKMFCDYAADIVPLEMLEILQHALKPKGEMAAENADLTPPMIQTAPPDQA